MLMAEVITQPGSELHDTRSRSEEKFSCIYLTMSKTGYSVSASIFLGTLRYKRICNAPIIRLNRNSSSKLISGLSAHSSFKTL